MLNIAPVFLVIG
ncbi:hypothetical protein VCHENC02_2098A, partial [Vibrio harveyi]